MKAKERPMFHRYLLKLFDDNSSQYILHSLPPNECYKVLYPALLLIQDDKQITNSDALSIRWIMHISAFFFTLLSNEDFERDDIFLATTQIILNKVYVCFFDPKTRPNISKEEYNSIAREMLLHLTLLCVPHLSDNVKSNVIGLVREIIKNKLKIFENETWETLFKITLGLCDFLLNNPSAINDWPELSPFLFSSLFRLLIYSTEMKINCWKLFNDYSKHWHYSQDFFLSWQSNFMICFYSLAPSWLMPAPLVINEPGFKPDIRPFDNDGYLLNVDPSFSMSVLISMLENAKNLDGTENYKILHHEFGFIADGIRENKNDISPLFSRRWDIDEIFEIFSMWPFAKCPAGFVEKSDPRKNSIESFAMLLEQGLIGRDSKWFQETINYLKKELLLPNSTLAPVLLPRLAKLICSHIRQTRDLINPIMKFCLRQRNPGKKKIINLNSTLIMSLILSISELYINKTNNTGTITSVENLLDLLFPPKFCNFNEQKGTQTWQLHILTLFASGCSLRCKTDILKYLESSEPPVEFYIYLMFIPLLFPSFLRSSDGADFVLSLVKNQNVINSLSDRKCERAFVFAIHMFILEKERFRPLSDEKRALLKSLKEAGRTDIASLIEILSFPDAQPMDIETARQVHQEGKEHAVFFSYSGTLLEFIDDPKKPLIIIVRSVYGVLTFEVKDLMSIEKGNPLKVDDYEPHKIQFDEEESLLASAFSDVSLAHDLEELTSIDEGISFSAYQSPFSHMHHPRIFSFLVNTGIVTATNEMKLTQIEGGDAMAEGYDFVPERNYIEVGVLHYTEKCCSGYGSSKATPQFAKFIDMLGEPINYHSPIFGDVGARAKTVGMVRIVFLCYALMDEVNEKLLDLPTLIIFNETGCEPIEKGFIKMFNNHCSTKKRNIIGARMENDPGEPEDGVVVLSSLNNLETTAYPVVHSIPRIVSKRNISSIIAIFCIIENVVNGEEKIFQRRKAILTQTQTGESGCKHLLNFLTQKI